MNGKSKSVLCVLDLETETVMTVDNIPEDICPGQAIWCPDDTGADFFKFLLRIDDVDLQILHWSWIFKAILSQSNILAWNFSFLKWSSVFKCFKANCK